MYGRILATLSLLTLAACERPEATTSSVADTAPAACNQVEPNLTIATQMRGNPTPAAQLPALQGGQIAPGVYDLASGEQFDGAPSWEDDHYVSLQVSNASDGSSLDWAQLAGPNHATRSDWTARLENGAAPTLTFTCGRTGTAPIAFSAADGELHLRMPDPSGTGMLDLTFIARQP